MGLGMRVNGVNHLALSSSPRKGRLHTNLAIGERKALQRNRPSVGKSESSQPFVVAHGALHRTGDNRRPLFGQRSFNLGEQGKQSGGHGDTVTLGVSTRLSDLFNEIMDFRAI